MRYAFTRVVVLLCGVAVAVLVGPLAGAAQTGQQTAVGKVDPQIMFDQMEEFQEVYAKDVRQLGGIREHLPDNFIKTFINYPFSVAETKRRFKDSLNNPDSVNKLSTLLVELRPMFRNFLIEDLNKRSIGLDIMARDLGMSERDASAYLVDKFLNNIERWILYVEAMYAADPTLSEAIASRYGYLMNGDDDDDDKKDDDKKD